MEKQVEGTEKDKDKQAVQSLWKTRKQQIAMVGALYRELPGFILVLVLLILVVATTTTTAIMVRHKDSSTRHKSQDSPSNNP